MRQRPLQELSSVEWIMKHRVRQLAAFAAIAAIGIAVACSDDDEPNAPPAVTRTTFIAQMNGANERPDPVTTTGTGTATLVKFNNDSITYTIQVASIDSVILSHIHAGDANTAGPILFAFPETNPPTSFTTLATLHTGTITPTSTFSGSFTWDSLLTRLAAGTAYVNVHTRANTGGEIRAQLVQQP
jgi:hypothetical protein